MGSSAWHIKPNAKKSRLSVSTHCKSEAYFPVRWGACQIFTHKEAVGSLRCEKHEKLRERWLEIRKSQGTIILCRHYKAKGFFPDACLKMESLTILIVLRWLSSREIVCNVQEMQIQSWVVNIPWRRIWQPIPVFFWSITTALRRQIFQLFCLKGHWAALTHAQLEDGRGPSSLKLALF